MARRGLFLATAAAVAILAVAAVAGEEPASQPAPAERLAPAAVPNIDDRGWGWKGPSFVEVYLANAYKETLLGVLVLTFFLIGLRKHRHDWKPLVLGLFALGIGLLDGALEMAAGCDLIARCGRQNLPDFADDIYRALLPIIASLIAALAGGLFTVILRWRNRRGAKTQGPEATPSA